MIEIRVKCCAGPNDNIPPHETIGFVPFADSPLAVTPVSTWNAAFERWDDNHYWQITQRATGWNLGQRSWRTRDAAMAVLLRCDPTFAAWALATGAVDDAATIACRVKFRMACE